MNNKQRTKRPREPIGQFSERLAALRALLIEDTATAGDQAIKLLEEYLESIAHRHGYHGDGSLGRYVMYLRGTNALDDQNLDRADSYTQLRNCLAHTYGLQTSPALAAELVEFVGSLLRTSALTAEHLMTRDVRTIDITDRLAHARDLMLHGGYGRLPTLHDSNGIVGLLTERDVVVAQALAERSGQSLETLSVGDALPEDAERRIALTAPEATRDEVFELLRRPEVIVCLVTRDGRTDTRPIGIITHADLLYRI